MTTGRRRRVDEIPPEQFAVVGANIRTLRLRKGWTQAELGELMGWPTTATVCGAEGHRDGRQRGFTFEEIERLAETFGVPALQLMTRCANCGGHPPTGFACLTCGVGLNMKPVQADRTQLSTEEEHPSSRQKRTFRPGAVMDKHTAWPPARPRTGLPCGRQRESS